MEMIAIFLFLGLTLKHFVVDFPLQKPYQWMNKGTYGHPGGILHAGLHGWATYLVLLFVTSWPIALILGVLDMFLHYHIDWAKMNLNAKMGWKSNEHEQFWTLLGFDQLLHQLTYILIVFIVITI